MIQDERITQCERTGYPYPPREEAETLCCPFFLKERRNKEGQTVMTCEAGRIRFPDSRSRRDLVYGYCAHPKHWEQCSLAQMMGGYYERK